jgi:hypothetical protein
MRWFALAAALIGGCAQVDSVNAEMVLPVDYRTTFAQVRNCRSSSDHMPAILVRMPPELVDVYNGGPYPFPAGALVVLEVYRDPGCMDLQEYAVMKKHQPGYDSAGADWQWYRLDERRLIVETGKIARCVSCHQDCGRTRDRVCAGP